jgi:hypothetical protein
MCRRPGWELGRDLSMAHPRRTEGRTEGHDATATSPVPRIQLLSATVLTPPSVDGRRSRSVGQFGRPSFRLRHQSHHEVDHEEEPTTSNTVGGVAGRWLRRLIPRPHGPGRRAPAPGCRKPPRRNRGQFMILPTSEGPAPPEGSNLTRWPSQRSVLVSPSRNKASPRNFTVPFVLANRERGVDGTASVRSPVQPILALILRIGTGRE